MVVENRAGASGAIGTALAAKAPPDGYTWVFVFDTHAVNPSLNPDIGFDTLKDLAPVMLVGTAPMAIATAAAKPYKTFADVSAAAKRSDGVTIGSIGNGSLGHLAAILISQAGGTKLIHVPYKGGGPLTTDAMGGQVDLAIASVAALSPHVRSGKLARDRGDRRQALRTRCRTCPRSRSRACAARRRSRGGACSRRPERRSRSSIGCVRKCRRRLQLADVRRDADRNARHGHRSRRTPDATQKFVVDEMQRWGKVVKDNGIKPD